MPVDSSGVKCRLAAAAYRTPCLCVSSMCCSWRMTSCLLVFGWTGSCLRAGRSFCSGLWTWYPAINVFFGLLGSRTWRFLQAALLVWWVFLLDSKNWENGSNEYVTDATKEAVSIERWDKGFHLRVTRPRVRSAVGWGKFVPLSV